MGELRQKLLILAAVIGLTLSCSLFVSERSPAAGCNKSIGMGGCLAITAIIDLSVDPIIECLEIEENNCQGGFLDIRNSCQESFILEGIEIPPSGYTSIDIEEDENGYISLIEVGDFAIEYEPDENKPVTVSGILGNQEIKLEFIKTAPLCER